MQSHISLITVRNAFLVFLILIQLPICVTYAQHNWQRTNSGGGGAIAAVGATANGTLVTASDLSGVYILPSGEAKWKVAGWNNGIHETHISSLGFHPVDGDIFMVGTYNGAYRTDDGGISFDEVLSANSAIGFYPYIEDIVFSKSNGNIAYLTSHQNAASTDGEVYKSIDSGLTWNPVVNEDLPVGLRIIKLIIHPYDDDIVYALTGKSRFSCSPANLYKSIDGGVGWQRIGTGLGSILDVDLDPTNNIPLNQQVVYVTTFATNPCPIDPNDFENFTFDDYVAGDWTSGDIYKSNNGGSSFNQIGTQTGIINVNSDNPQIIKLINIVSMMQYFNDYGNIAEDQVGTFTSTDGGSNWNHTGSILNWNRGYREQPWLAFVWSFNGPTKTVMKDEFNSSNMYASFGQWAWASTDGGDTINNISTVETPSSSDYWLSTGVENIAGHCLEINEFDPDIVYMGAYDIGFWHSKNGGQSWKQLLPNLQDYEDYVWDSYDGSSLVPGRNDDVGANVATIVSDPARKEVVWASFSEQQHNTQTGLFKSINYGENWQLITAGLPVFNDSLRMYGLSIDYNSPSNNRVMYLTVDGFVYKSNTDGNSWSLVFTNSNNGGLKFTQVDRFNGTVYAGGKSGLFRSINGGDDWSQIGSQYEIEMQGTLANMRLDIVPTWSEDGAGLKAWQGVFALQTDPNVAGRVFVVAFGTGKGLYRSNDSGSSWEKLLTDDYMRGVAISPNDSNVVYATASASYHSGASVDSSGIQFSTNAGSTWQSANVGMAWNYGGTIQIAKNNKVWAWSPGTGIQYSIILSLDLIFKNGFE